MEGTSVYYFPTADTVDVSTYKCITELMEMEKGIIQCADCPPGGVTLDKQQQEILCIKSNIVSRLEMLFKEAVEGGHNPPPTTSHLPPSASPYNFPTIQIACCTISKCIQELLQMRQLMDQIDASLSQSNESLDEEQQNVLLIKSSVVSQLEMLFKTTKEADEEALDDDEGVVQGKESVGRQKMEAHLSLHETKETEGKYLCLSNGYEIWCLDPEQSTCNTDPRHLPILTTLNLLRKELVTSVGLFHMGPCAYVIGGKKFLGWDVHTLPVPNAECMDLYRDFCYTQGTKGSSPFSYSLVLKGDTLTTSKCKIRPLKKPKFWPIVEKIGKWLHVIDGFPFYLACNRRCQEFSFTHEVCKVDDDNRCGSWKQIRTGMAIERIFNHVVVGNRIYAESHEGRYGDYCLEFDSRTGQWRRLPTGDPVLAFEAKTVCEILSLGTGKCAGVFSVSSPRGGGEDDHLFVIFAIVRGDYDFEDIFTGVIAVAYLVTLTGQVICYQHVPGFYSEDKLLQPRDMIAATMIHVGKRTLCSVVSAARRKDDREKEHLFINTFSVKMLDSARVRVRDILAKKTSEAEAGPGVELEFVSVSVEDRFIYETALGTCQGGWRRCPGWRACFLTRP